MRERMISDFHFKAAVFIGGMEGILEEFYIFRRLHPNATIIPVVSTGGAVVELGKHLRDVDDDLKEDPDYVSVFYRHLEVPVREKRFRSPTEQPPEPELRLWHPPNNEA